MVGKNLIGRETIIGGPSIWLKQTVVGAKPAFNEKQALPGGGVLSSDGGQEDQPVVVEIPASSINGPDCVP